MSWYPPSPKRRPGSGPWRAAGKRPFGATWWGRAWVDALEQRARLDPNRLPRGRTYARTGAVDNVEVRVGEIVASVQGSRARAYRVTVRVRVYTDKEWERTLSALASQAGHLASLLDGEMPPEVVDDLAAAGIDLLPVAGEVQPRCSCPDWADPCKHSAAVCYTVADTLDGDPFLLFQMRGRSRDRLLAGLRAARAAAVGLPDQTAGQPAGYRGAQTSDPGQSWPTDPGVHARRVWDRWASLSSDGLPPLPAIPLPPTRPGRPTVLAVDPPASSGLTTGSLETLAADAAQRAWALAHGDDSSGLELSTRQDLARRAAAVISASDPSDSAGRAGPGGGAPAAPAGHGEDQLRQLASAAGLAGRELLNYALAWREGGREGLFVLLEDWDPPPGAMLEGRALLGGGARVRRNRVTLGDRQLRRGRDARWYPFRRSGRTPGSGQWMPDGPPVTAPSEPPGRRRP